MFCRICLQTIRSGCPLSSRIRVTVHPSIVFRTLQSMMVQICNVTFDSKYENGMPKFLCENCKNRVISAFGLRLAAQRADVVLKENLEEKDYQGVEDNTSSSELLEEGYGIDGEGVQPRTCSASNEDTNKTSRVSHHTDPQGAASCAQTTTNDPKNLQSHKCKIYGRSFATGDLLSDHMRLHTGLKTFPSKTYKKKLPSLENNDKETTYLCYVCGRTCRTMKLFSEHLYTHTRVKRFACDRCPGRFDSRRNLRDHQMRHTGEKPFLCDVCGKRFSSKRRSLDHKRFVHSSERPFSCQYCDKTFKYIHNRNVKE